MKYSAIDLGRLLAVSSFMVLLFGNSSAVNADDTEIYQATYQAGSTGRPKVLIIMDDSGSMSTEVQAGGERPEYDPNGTYVSVFDSSKVYWTSGNNPPSSNTGKHFPASVNRCEESLMPLDNVGKFTSKAKRWRPASGSWVTETEWVCKRWRRGRCRRWQQVTSTYWDGNDAEWRSLTSSDQSPTHVDCRVDVTNPGNAGNGPNLGDGYPYQPSAPDAADSEAYTANRGDANISWGNKTYTFYSAHYMDWFNDDTIVSVSKDRMQVAQEVVNSLINSNTGIDFGLATFNYNGDNHHGGRIVQRIIEGMTLAQRADLAGDSGIVNSLTHDGWTPLCESTYEVYRYLAGESRLWGDNRDTGRDWPPRDMAAENNGTYIAPTSDCAYTYVILMTDGFPTYDTSANSRIETLTGKNCANYLSDHNGEYRENCLPVLTEYMANQDLDGDPDNGNQFGITYTIGFGVSQDLLEDAAQKGKGLYYQAENSVELAAAFQGAIINILSTDSTFTSPGVAVDTFTRTRSRNEVFFAMFKPGASANWGGNIKRLDIAYIDDTAVLVDKNGLPAMDEATGLIKDNANTLWSSSADGPDVDSGGVGALLAATNLTTRASHVYSNTGTSAALELLSPANMTADAYGFDLLETLLNDTGEEVDEAIEGFLEDGVLADQLLYAFWGVANQTELNDAINWGLGYDLEDEDQDDSTSDNRPWILGDILHSEPFIMNYGARGSYTEANPDVRIIAGTNAGFLHMFSNDDGQEDWAFFPKELASVMSKRKENGASLDHVYGIDASVVVHTEDLNYDGTLDHSVGDKAWMYFGLRRGGDYMFAMDISNPDVPSMMWSISPDLDDFLEMGQTWSEPIVASIPGYYDDAGKSKPVLIFGAGYDPDKDDTDSLAVDNTDDIGRGIFIVDAATGALVWSVTPADDSSTNMQETALLHSVPAGVTVLDSNGDDLIDRVYFADTGGNLWRLDMPGDSLPTSSQNTWFLVKMFAANGGTKATDRRFFISPDVVRTDYLGQPVDAILLGSGDRTNPAELDNVNDINDPSVDNQFYMIRDIRTGPYFTARDDGECDSDPGHDFRCSLPLSPSALYDVTDNDLQDGNETEQAAARTALNDSAGWRMSLAANGEKALARAITIDGKVYFTTFSPDAQVLNICEPLPGTGRLYNVGLLEGKRVRDFDDDGTDERFISVGGLIPDTPSPHFDAEGEIRLLLPPGGTAPKIVGNPMETDSSIQEPYGSYWHRDDG